MSSYHTTLGARGTVPGCCVKKKTSIREGVSGQRTQADQQPVFYSTLMNSSVTTAHTHNAIHCVLISHILRDEGVRAVPGRCPCPRRPGTRGPGTCPRGSHGTPPAPREPSNAGAPRLVVINNDESIFSDLDVVDLGQNKKESKNERENITL